MPLHEVYSGFGFAGGAKKWFETIIEQLLLIDSGRIKETVKSLDLVDLPGVDE